MKQFIKYWSWTAFIIGYLIGAIIDLIIINIILK
jgi:hypothetical protein